ncbi:hypothetical protein KDJ56_07590 [Brevibacillus composti]|uniref:ATPase dynein-related AAA domain-containing protein n=1 Tax=Brevibacillus composti TaxID=2796470 RepID=A0A7T5ENE3_9BACL|nr:hypothetical protein [Brevibacillus composti]QQE75788.1 hypothetical protein JD108_07910 [Brevibacillus composti]QUO42814.1 hypothetical protein KDJ56_07590 [Brevibacillus composti]
MKKYELTQKIFRELLHHAYQPIDISFSDEWRCRVTPGEAQIDSEKDYLGSIPLHVEIFHHDTTTQTMRLTVHCMQNKFIPSLEDQAGGYAFRIYSGKSELLYRAMQVALYDYTEASTQVQLYSDLDSKKGDKHFLQQMKQWLQDYEAVWKPWKGELLPSDQFRFLTYDLATASIVEEKQDVLSSAIFIALLKGVLKKEIMLSLPLLSLTPSASTPSGTRRVWKIAPGENAGNWPDALQHSEVFVGWDELGDLRSYPTKEELMAAYKKVFEPEQEPTRTVNTLWAFSRELRVGDIVIANRGWKQLVGIGRITGEYEYKPERGGYPNRRKVEWIITHDVQFDENVFSTPTLTTVYQQRLGTIQKEVVRQVPNGEQKWRSLFGELQSTPVHSVIDDFQRFLQSRQFHFSREMITRFLTSLQAKPFVILSGMSGTGKTKIAQLFADYLKQGPEKKPRRKAADAAPEENRAFLSVRPDWLDHRGLLGTYNPLTEAYEATPLLKLMLRAGQNPELPFFVILDEMNLAKVEYYFSDFLSCIESRRVGADGELVQESIHLHNQPEELLYVDADHQVYAIPPRIEIPANLYIIGTVNMDETTYMFSPKVLDRANVIECNDVDLHRYWAEEETAARFQSAYTPEEKIDWFTLEGEFHQALYTKEYRQPEFKEALEEAYFRLLGLHQLLEEEGYSFGYRVVDEVMNYLHITHYREYCTLDEALDSQIVQKILPKLHGNRKQLEGLMLKLLRYAIGEHVELEQLTQLDQDILAFDEQYRYPLSGKKIYSMYRRLLKTGYCSFIS